MYLRPCAKLRSLRHVEKVAFSPHPFSVASDQRMIITIHKNRFRAYPLREELHSLYCDTWIPALYREGSVLSSFLLCLVLSANDH
jgi:hypothetical protein